MIVVRIFLNACIMAAEIAAVAAVAWAGFTYPFTFAAVTAAVCLVMGLNLEAARLKNEMPFYFGRTSKLRLLMLPLVAGVEALMKAVLAGLAALFTFAGTSSDRLFWVAVLFGLVVYAGSALLRTLSISLSAYPARWGFFRLAPPLGLLFSAGIAALAFYGAIPPASVGDIGWKLVWEIPEKPSISQVSELFFQLKQAFDDFIVTIASGFVNETAARAIGIVVSVNVLAGFVASVYAALIAGAVRVLEERLP